MLILEYRATKNDAIVMIVLGVEAGVKECQSIEAAKLAGREARC